MISDDYRRKIAGMSYEQASREGSRLINYAHRYSSWFELGDKLNALQGIMERELLVMAQKGFTDHMGENIVAMSEISRHMRESYAMGSWDAEPKVKI